MMSEHHALAEAIEGGDEPMVRELLRSHPDLVDSPKWTPPPLHCAVLWDQPRIAEVLLEHGADIEIRDPDRNTTPLRYAIVYCRPEMVRLLASHGANTGPIVDQGTTALRLASIAAEGEFEHYDDMPPREGYAEIVKLLEELGIK